MRGRLGRAGLVLLLAVCACGPQAQQTGTRTPDDVDRDALYGHLPECPPPPPAIAHDDIPGFVAPAGTIVTAVNALDPLVQVTGYVEATPLDVRDEFEGREEVRLVYIEDEGFETELLVDSEGYSTFVKAQVACRDASRVAIVIAPGTDDAALPVPGQQGG